jgi:hypothetical protein
MLKTAVAVLISAALMFAAPAFAVDGVVLINQSTVLAAGGFPYRITQPGSYKLSGNLVVPAGVDGIGILTDGVTIDLNGFRISGAVTCFIYAGGVVCDPFQPSSPAGISGTTNDVTIRNGSIVGFAFGIELLGTNNLVEEIHATGNFDTGIQVSKALVRRNTVGQNGNTGIHADVATVMENVVIDNGFFALRGTDILYGSNLFGSLGVFADVSSVSQKNNSCNGTVC